MDRRLAESRESLRFRIDATRCDGQGVCVLIAPELFALDRYGIAYVVPGSERLAAEDPDVRARGLEADAMCPRNAIFEAPLPPARPAPVAAPPTSVAAPSRLLLDAPESVPDWQRRGGWAHHDRDALLDLVERAGIRGHGGAAFSTAAKWRRVAGAERSIVVVNGAEREPGTMKDRHLLTHRPGLVLDGIRLAMRAVGATEAIAAVDEDAIAEHDALTAAITEATELGLLDGYEIRTHKVPTSYVAGEETALISLLSGGPAVPRLRPPFPSDSGVFGRPTLVQNVETLAQVALAAALGADEFRAAGTEEAPGTGLFSVGPFGGPYHVVERPYGYALRDLLAETGLAEGARAVLVGGYAGGLLTPDALDIALTPAALAAAGASLGTKSVQVIGADRCPVGVAAEIVGYFAAETADQCPPCSRGLPDMAGLLRGLETGTGGPEAVAELDLFMSTLFDRGVCRLPDGAARLALSLLRNFAEVTRAHTTDGCPIR
ncbi:ferredoxin [Streptosporangium sp. NBC_01755]|uniref:NADH-ubiquinone oxidoreductase-F iron-sulfur binding region domain-containing protein n=1 Tax=unclassified Streptosporangium TaxID=2632669 RepID=UPI002DD8873C|nr:MULTISPECIES: NADH-ubiquinone oxidoreductase-F iron-sulfur binding region domain-containing protein [unclassified Streptosporangium]WSA24641.1 ferredoxin [Streptosporangium sp. NBC_01810]WSC97283.1 ferredoxin [Streptosporangium sp. NBC_01755]